MNLKPMLFCLALAAPAANAATVLEYVVDGRCATEFDRMVFDGLHARVDNDDAGQSMSTIFDDGEQIMTMLMHETKQTMVMESDDDAVDFQSDVGRSSMLYTDNQMKKLGVDQSAMMAQAQSMLANACPELEGVGMGDPDYAEKMQRCTAGMGAGGAAMDPQLQKDMLKAMASGKPMTPRQAPSEPARYRTTDTERGASKTVAGIACTVETTRRGDTLLREECLAGLDTLGLDEKAMRRLRRMVKIGQGMAAGMASVKPEMLPDADRPPRLALERTCYDAGRATGTATISITRDARVAASEFVVPADYRPMSFEMPDTGR